MLKSLYSGVSGMKGFQTKMDVIANNIANTNTTAFKSGRARFQDMISQTNANASGPTAAGMGGINPQQVGLGVKVSAIDTIMTGGSLQSTGRDLDFGIEREGFFAVSSDVDGTGGADGSEEIIVGNKYYTRDGAFFRDYEGNLVNSNGERILGYVPIENYSLDPNNLNTYNTVDDPNLSLPGFDDDGNVIGAPDADTELAKLKPLIIPEVIAGDLKLQSYSVDGSGKIIGVYSDGKAYLLGQVGLVKFSNPEGLEKVGNNNYAFSNNSGEPVAGQAGGDGFGTIRQNFLEMSNVDLANEFTEMIIASRAYSANSRSITTSDEMLQELINLKR